MTTGYLMLDHPNPYTPQGTFPRRGTRGKLTGTCILHTTEGAWTAGVQSLINLVRSRSDYGCYHRACDWQDIALLYPWEWETWQDSETNNWAVGISAACRTSDWRIMPADIREGYYRNMAKMAADFVNYMRTTYGITVPLKRITGAQARAGVPGFAAHGDSGLHRSDPGADFDWATFLNYTSQALGSATTGPQPTTTKKDFLMALTDKQQTDLYNRITRYVDAPISAVDDKVWATTVNRGGKKISALQELADAKTEAQALRAAVVALAKNPGLSADQITAAVKAGIADGTVTVDVNVNGAV